MSTLSGLDQSLGISSGQNATFQFCLNLKMPYPKTKMLKSNSISFFSLIKSECGGWEKEEAQAETVMVRGGVQRTRGPTSSRVLFVQFFLAASWSSIACWMYIFPTKISFSSTDSSFKEMGQFRRSRASFKTALFSKYCRGLIASNLRNTERRQQK